MAMDAEISRQQDDDELMDSPAVAPAATSPADGLASPDELRNGEHAKASRVSSNVRTPRKSRLALARALKKAFCP